MERNLVFLINEKNSYARHLGAVLASIFENSKVFWRIYIIYTKLSRESMEKIKIMEKNYPVKINFLKLEDEIIEEFNLGKGTHLDKIVFGRLHIPNLLKNKDKALYLDIDIIVNQPLEELYDIDLNDFSIGAVPDGKWDQEQSKRRLGLENNHIYFNAGVMLMDLKKLRENKFFDKVIEYCLNPDRDLKLNEQDALNIIFGNNYKSLDLRWNYTHGHSEEQNFEGKEIGIIHYTGSIKPWDCRSLSPFRKEYWRYLKKTPWQEWKEENFNILNIVKREVTNFKIWSRKYRYKIKGEKNAKKKY